MNCYGTEMHGEILRNTFGGDDMDIYYLYPKQCYDTITDKRDAKTISRGHLTANSDFVYDYQRENTFFLSNAAPQWQITNGGNYIHLETFVKNVAHEKKSYLDVYSGTHGEMKVTIIEIF
jgi:DNA/RNA endonuclease G (NUC1)